jgi:hypothetical protein
MDPLENASSQVDVCISITSMGTPPVGSYLLPELVWIYYNSLQTCWSVKAWWLAHDRLHIAAGELSHEQLCILKRKGAFLNWEEKQSQGQAVNSS